VGSLLLSNADGLRVPLGELADVVHGDDRYPIRHEGARRRRTVTCNPTRDVVSFFGDARRAVTERVEMPPGVYASFGGEAEVQAEARDELLAHAPIAGAGGVLALLVFGWLAPGAGRISIGTLVGFVTLFGITTRNSIMMISHFDHLVREEGMAWGPEAALRGATERVVPIPMTASVTGLGLLPLALGSGEAGREIEGPMAVVILGGLVTSTAPNLLVLPTLARRFGRFERVSADEEGLPD
jgi:Cu/Ag efflux pump CusA